MKIPASLNAPAHLACISVLMLIGCASTPKESVRPNEHIEIGWTPRTVLQTPAYAWFDSGYAAYQPRKEYVERLRRMKDSVNIIVIYGTWCIDSRREVPRLLKVMDQAELPQERIQLIAIDRARLLPSGIAKEFDVQHTPTIIVRFRGVEAGRIIESTKNNFEQDIVEMLEPFFQ